jgi:hypothetical protein
MESAHQKTQVSAVAAALDPYHQRHGTCLVWRKVTMVELMSSILSVARSGGGTSSWLCFLLVVGCGHDVPEHEVTVTSDCSGSVQSARFHF